MGQRVRIDRHADSQSPFPGQVAQRTGNGVLLRPRKTAQQGQRRRAHNDAAWMHRSFLPNPRAPVYLPPQPPNKAPRTRVTGTGASHPHTTVVR